MSTDGMANQNKFISRIEGELLKTLFDYVVQFFDSKLITAQKPKTTPAGNLENIVNSKPKIEFMDIEELESLLTKSLNNNFKLNKTAKVTSGDFIHSIELRRQKNKNQKSERYSITIKYEENQQEDKTKISVKRDDKLVSSAEITEAKNPKDRVAPYSIQLSYESNYAEERLTITYKLQLKNYLKQHLESKEDMSKMVPLKWLNILPESMMGGVLGFTYLGENFMGRRADLVGKTARMVDIHESIHTPDEYETRVLTDWILTKTKPKYFK